MQARVMVPPVLLLRAEGRHHRQRPSAPTRQSPLAPHWFLSLAANRCLVALASSPWHPSAPTGTHRVPWAPGGSQRCPSAPRGAHQSPPLSGGTLGSHQCAVAPSGAHRSPVVPGGAHQSHSDAHRSPVVPIGPQWCSLVSRSPQWHPLVPIGPQWSPECPSVPGTRRAHQSPSDAHRSPAVPIGPQ